MVYKAKKGDYVSWEEGSGDDKEIKYGKIVATSGSNVHMKYDEEGKKDDPTVNVSNFPKLAKSVYARMKMRAKPNFREVAENIVVASVYHPFVMRNTLFGAENMSFALADFVHEFVIKGFAEQAMDALAPTSLKGDEGSAIIQTADFSDALRKLPFVVGLQHIFQRIMFKKPWNHQVMSNILGGFGILAVPNMGDRMWYNDESVDPTYTYP